MINNMMPFVFVAVWGAIYVKEVNHVLIAIYSNIWLVYIPQVIICIPNADLHFFNFCIINCRCKFDTFCVMHGTTQKSTFPKKTPGLHLFLISTCFLLYQVVNRIYLALQYHKHQFFFLLFRSSNNAGLV